MKTLDSMPKFLAYALSQAVKHPTKPVTYFYCPGVQGAPQAGCQGVPGVSPQGGKQP